MPILHEAAKLGMDNKQYALAQEIYNFLDDNCVNVYSAKELENLLDKRDLLNLLGTMCIENLCATYHINGTGYYGSKIGHATPIASPLADNFMKLGWQK